MSVLVVGANGQIGRKIVGLLEKPRAMIRDPAQAANIKELGGDPVVADLEQDIGPAVAGCDTVIFTAGSGGQTGPDKTMIVDLWGAMKVIDAAAREKVKRFLMVSAIGAAEPDRSADGIKHYMIAKRVADDYLVQSGLNYTIVRPGGLTNEAGTGTITAGEKIGHGKIPREDVARTLVLCLELEETYRKTFAVLSGNVPIVQALRRL